MHNDLIEKALRIAATAHNGQTRKYADVPFIAHPVAVTLKLTPYNFPAHVIAAALTHDILEDTDFGEERLRNELGDEVVDIVKAVSYDYSLPTKEMKETYIETARNGPEGTMPIVAADKIHNMESILTLHAEHGAETWERLSQSKEKRVWFERKILELLRENWEHPLIEEHEALLRRLENLEE